MKHARLSLFLVIIIFGGTYSHATMLEQTAIDKKALEIEKKLTHDRYLMYGFTTIAIAHEIYQWVPMLKDLISHRSSVAVVEKQKLSFIQALKVGMQHLFYTKEGWISLIQSGFSMGGFVIISQMGEKFIHPDTLRWYIHTYAPYYVTIEMMKKRLYGVQDTSITQEQRHIINEILQLLYERLVYQAELICGYMTYKAKHFDVAEKMIGERAKISMLKSHKNWLDRIAEQLNSIDCDFNILETLLDTYEESIAAQVNHFALVEGETQQDKLAVTKYLKQNK